MKQQDITCNCGLSFLSRKQLGEHIKARRKADDFTHTIRPSPMTDERRAKLTRERDRIDRLLSVQ